MGDDPHSAVRGIPPVFLYELALTLDQRSSDVIEVAEGLGLGEVLAGSELNPDQVAAIRAHYAALAAPPPLAPLNSGLPSLPAVPTGPLVAEPGLGQPGGPASWGPPAPEDAAGPPDPLAAPMPTAPASWGPPPGVGEPEHPGPRFEYGDAPMAEVVDAPFGLADVTLPPPPAAPASPTNADEDEPRFARSQVAAIAVAVVLVVGLFGFMVANTGPDKEREQEIASGEAAIQAEIKATTTTAPTTTATPTTEPPAQDVYEAVDVDKFCEGGLRISTFELRLAAGLLDGDMGEVQDLVATRRADWRTDVDLLAQGAAPTYLNDIEKYRAGYEKFFDAIASSSTVEDAYAKVDRLELVRAANAGQEFSTQIEFLCT